MTDGAAWLTLVAGSLVVGKEVLAALAGAGAGLGWGWGWAWFSSLCSCSKRKHWSDWMRRRKLWSF